jgi:ferritin-like metal-binding protein YciE
MTETDVEGAELMKENPEGGILDVGLLSGAHYSEHARLLQQTLDEEKQTDELLTELALQTVNRDADAGISGRP